MWTSILTQGWSAALSARRSYVAQLPIRCVRREATDRLGEECDSIDELHIGARYEQSIFDPISLPLPLARLREVRSEVMA